MATIRDIAAKAGVSPAAVSRILSNDPGLSVAPATRKRVLDCAAELGYSRKRTRDKSGFKMGILQWFTAEEELSDDYYLSIRKGIEDYCDANAISLARAYRVDGATGSLPEDTDGVICVGKFSTEEASALIKHYKNILFLDMEVEHPEVTTITMDFKTAVNEAMRYLIKLGHKKIAYIGGQEYASGSEPLEDPRKKAYESYVRKHKLEKDDLLSEGSFSAESGYEQMKAMLAKAKPDAVLAASDAIAVGVIKAINDSGLKCPGDISVIGINDDRMSAYMTPALTTMRAPAYDMGQHGANLVYAAGNLSISTPLKVMIPCVLIERESCSPRKETK